MDQLRVYFIPADTDKPMGVKMIDNDWQAMGKLVGGYIEIVRTLEMPAVQMGPKMSRMAMVVNEDGQFMGLEQNPRASIYYPFGSILGDVFLVCERGPNFVSLPEAIVDWDGPGSKLPAGC